MQVSLSCTASGGTNHQPEALALSILEAMSYSLAVVATPHGGITETVVDKRIGFLVEPGDIEAAAEAFLKLPRIINSARWVRPAVSVYGEGLASKKR